MTNNWLTNYFAILSPVAHFETNYCFELPTFGSALDLTFTFGELNTGGEDLALDDISVHCTTDPTSLPGTLLAACTPFENNTCFFMEDFETDPVDFVSSCGVSMDSGDYFGVGCEDGFGCDEEIRGTFSTYTNADGRFFAVRDMDKNTACDKDADNFTFGSFTATGIDISGASAQVYLCMDIAETNSAAENSSSGSFDSWDGESEVNIFTTIDGTERLLISLQSTDGSNSVPGFDTGCDLGDAEADVLTTNTFTTFCFALDGGGNSVDIAIEVAQLNTGGEDIAIDNISLCAANNTANLPGTVIPSCNVDRPLPVELTTFRGELLPKGASFLSWETASETENDYFDLEYSTDGEDFTFLARLEGQGNASTATKYSYEHPTLLGEMNYYRLKQVDFDGAYVYSPVIALRKEIREGESLVYPNPAHDFIVYVGAGATLTVYDMYGKQIQQVRTQTGAETIDVRSLHPGAYLLEIVNEDDTREVKRFIKSE